MKIGAVNQPPSKQFATQSPAFAGGRGGCSEFALRMIQQLLAQEDLVATLSDCGGVELPSGTTENAEFAEMGV